MSDSEQNLDRGASRSFFMLAGEHSGDGLGAALMQGLKARGNVEFVGVGGPLMEAQGLKSLLPMSELCVMGIWEIVWQLSRLLRLIHGVVEEIEKAQPDAVLMVDLPDFNFRVAKRLKKRGIYKGKIIHYVAPSVWAWRPGRAKAVSAYLDGLMCLFPFEPKYFEKHGLETAYVGHPLITRDPNGGEAAAFYAAREITQEETVVGLFFGSREKELDAHAELMIDAVLAVKEDCPDIVVVAPTTDDLEYNVREILKEVPGLRSYVVTKPEAKWEAIAACDVAVAVSGTVGLELAYMNVPHVIAYKASTLTYLLVRLLVKVRFAHLANILLDKEVVPEFLQGKCNALSIARGLLQLLKDEERAAEQRKNFDALREKLQEDIKRAPQEQAAEFVFEILSRRDASFALYGDN